MAKQVYSRYKHLQKLSLVPTKRTFLVLEYKKI